MAESEPLNIVPANSAPEPEPEDPSVPKTCRLCAAEKSGCVDIFGKSDLSAGLAESCGLCLPILVSRFSGWLERPVCLQQISQPTSDAAEKKIIKKVKAEKCQNH